MLRELKKIHFFFLVGVRRVLTKSFKAHVRVKRSKKKKKYCLLYYASIWDLFFPFQTQAGLVSPAPGASPCSRWVMVGAFPGSVLGTGSVRGPHRVRLQPTPLTVLQPPRGSCRPVSFMAGYLLLIICFIKI